MTSSVHILTSSLKLPIKGASYNFRISLNCTTRVCKNHVEIPPKLSALLGNFENSQNAKIVTRDLEIIFCKTADRIL